MASIVSMKGVVKAYVRGKQRVEVLRGIDVEVEQGEFLALMGPSGSGKTTLLNLIGGLDRPDRGEITVAGERLDALRPSKLTKWRARHVGFIFQFYNLLPVLSAVENVELPLLVSGVSAKDARKKAMDALEIVHLTDWATHKPAELSGGQRQRVTIARALVNDPAIVWGDEPTGDLDSTNAAEIMQLLIDLNQRHNQTFVLVTHDPGIAQRTRRIIRMQDGQIISDEPVGDGWTANASPAAQTQPEAV
jgi:putative ABC transport system ATP-binding protein